MDGVGYREGETAYSLYGCPDELAAGLRGVLGAAPGLVEGEAWYQGDHMVFVQNGVPALAITTGSFTEAWTQIAHTPKDTLDLVDPARLASLAKALHGLLHALDPIS